VASLEKERSWRALQEIWNRGWPADSAPATQRRARAAFDEALASTAPAEIIEAAKAWVGAADAPRFLPRLDAWLDSGGWRLTPPKKPRAFYGSKSGRRRSRGGAGGNGRRSAGEAMAELARQAREAGR
jgi:hypothetical protein